MNVHDTHLGGLKQGTGLFEWEVLYLGIWYQEDDSNGSLCYIPLLADTL
jgi:hypothetical protein